MTCKAKISQRLRGGWGYGRLFHELLQKLGQREDCSSFAMKEIFWKCIFSCNYIKVELKI